MKLTLNSDQLKEKGYTIVPSFFEDQYMDIVSKSIDNSYKLCRKIQIENGIDAITDGTVHHLLAINDNIYLDILTIIAASPLYNFIKGFFGGNFIINSYGGVINLTSK